MGVPSGVELFIIVAVIVLLFGGKKIPELAKGLGSGIKNFKKAVKEDDDEVVDANTPSEKIEKTTEAKKEETTETTTNA